MKKSNVENVNVANVTSSKKSSKLGAAIEHSKVVAKVEKELADDRFRNPLSKKTNFAKQVTKHDVELIEEAVKKTNKVLDEIEVTAKLEKAEKKAVKAANKSKESNEKLAVRLLKEKADDKAILASFTKVYKEKGIVDKTFIAKRASIYMEIAKKKVAKK
jgi:hypothetical protein